MGTRGMIVVEVVAEDAFQVCFVENDHMIETFAADRADQTLDVMVLPRGTRRDRDVFDAELSQATERIARAATAEQKEGAELFFLFTVRFPSLAKARGREGDIVTGG